MSVTKIARLITTRSLRMIIFFSWHLNPKLCTIERHLTRFVPRVVIFRKTRSRLLTIFGRATDFDLFGISAILLVLGRFFFVIYVRFRHSICYILLTFVHIPHPFLPWLTVSLHIIQYPIHLYYNWNISVWHQIWALDYYYTYPNSHFFFVTPQSKILHHWTPSNSFCPKNRHFFGDP